VAKTKTVALYIKEEDFQSIPISVRSSLKRIVTVRKESINQRIMEKYEHLK
jgi:hypothetical protein